MRAEPLRETDLYFPVKEYLIEQGYQVNAEVKGCDITATKGNELVVIELKTHFNATLLIQAVERQRIADAVYIALPHPTDTRRNRNWRGMCHLLKRLEIGLILIHFLKSGPRIEVHFHPSLYSPRRQQKKRRTVIREIRDRNGDYNVGGSTGTKVVTAYRENAIHIACCLEARGTLSPSQLRDMGTGKKTQSILGNNFYGWYERISKGLYGLHPDGKKALASYPAIADFYEKKIGEL
ncbi:MAG: hypothetical protein CMN78_06635 [Spirochaetales bacterium]|nr:hypothetical protein [Spirochaetales bacterium]